MSQLTNNCNKVKSYCDLAFLFSFVLFYYECDTGSDTMEAKGDDTPPESLESLNIFREQGYSVKDMQFSLLEWC